jgi:cytoskeleton protein RodZ
MSNKDQTKDQEQKNGNGRSPQVGALLRASRLRVGEDLRDVSDILCIRYLYLEAIEECRYGDLPGNTYAVGFIRSYAEHLGLDGDEVVRRYRVEQSGQKSATDLAFPTPVPDSGVPKGAIVFIGVLIALLVYGGWYVTTTDESILSDLISPVPDHLKHLVTGDDDAAKTNPDAAGAAKTDTQSDTPPEAATETAATEIEQVVRETTAAAEQMASDAGAAAKRTAEATAESVASATESTVETASESASAAAQAVTDAASRTEPAASNAAQSAASAASVAAKPVQEATRKTPEAMSQTAAPSVTETPAAAATSATSMPKPAETATPATSAASAPDQSAATVTETAAATPTTETTTTEATDSTTAATSQTETVAAAPAPTETAPQKPASPEVTAEDLNALVLRQATGVAGSSTTDTTSAQTPQPPQTASLNAGDPAETSGIVIHATSSSWVEIRNPANGDIVFTGLMSTGNTFNVPDTDGLTLDTGNAGALDITVDGTSVPKIGGIGAVRKNVSLNADRLKAGTAVSR